MSRNDKDKIQKATQHLLKIGATVAPEPDHVLIGGVRVDKIKKFDWVRDIGHPGKQTMLHKSLLNIDQSYQRPASHGKILKIAATFSWVAFGVAMVNQRADGSYYVFDAQHRVEAAKMRSDITMIPCIVHQIGGKEEESKAFKDINVNRNALRYIEKFNAMLVHNDPIAHQIGGLLAAHGYEVIKCRKPGRYISCLSLIARLLEEDADMLHRIFPVVVDAAHGGFILDHVLQAFWYIEKFGNFSMTDPKWRERVKKHTPDEYEQAIVKAKAAFASGGMKRWAEGIVDVLNKAVRGPKLEMASRAKASE